MVPPLKSYHSRLTPSVCRQVLTLLNDGHLDVRVLAQLVSTAQAGRASASDDNVTLRILIQVLQQGMKTVRRLQGGQPPATNAAMMLMLNISLANPGQKQASRRPPCLALLMKRAGSKVMCSHACKMYHFQNRLEANQLWTGYKANVCPP